MRQYDLSTMDQLLVSALISGSMCISVAHAGGPTEDRDLETEGQQAVRGIEPSTYFLQGELVAIEVDGYVIRDLDGQEHTIIVTKDTSTLGNPKVGDQVEVEYLETGKALLLMPIPER